MSGKSHRWIAGAVFVVCGLIFVIAAWSPTRHFTTLQGRVVSGSCTSERVQSGRMSSSTMHRCLVEIEPNGMRVSAIWFGTAIEGTRVVVNQSRSDITGEDAYIIVEAVR